MVSQNPSSKTNRTTSAKVTKASDPANPDAGEIWSIVGIICIFFALHIPGLILSLIGRSKSIASGHSGGLGTAGAIINGILSALTVLGLLFFGLIFALLVAARGL